MSTTINNQIEPTPFPVRRFSVEEYHRLGELGILNADEAVELLSGWIVPKMNHNPLHDATVELADRALRSHVPEGWRIRIQSAITTDDSEPEPDLAIVRGSIQDHISRHPGPSEIALLVEVAESSVQRDRLKAALYARAGIQHYWIVNLVESQLEVYSSPVPTDSVYRHHQVLSGQETVSISIGKDYLGDVSVQDLFP
jgi:Uma2 family endonuclease